jgi:four helix bundle protein
MQSENIFIQKSFNFAVKIVQFCNSTKNNYQQNILNKQLLRSGTAVGALIREAQNAESKADFIHKLAIAQKECDESCYWLEILNKTKMIDGLVYKELHFEASSLLRLIRSAIITTKTKMKNKEYL